MAGMVWRGAAGCGAVGLGLARWGRQGMARHDPACLGWAGQGRAWQVWLGLA